MTTGISNTDASTSVGAELDYVYRPGMSYRGAPPRMSLTVGWQEDRFLGSIVPDRLTAEQQDLLDRFVDHYWQGDALMDPVAEYIRDHGADGRRLLDQILDQGIASVDDAPQVLVDLFAGLDVKPEWFDPEDWERGRRLWIDSSAAGIAGMFLMDSLGTFVADEVSMATWATGRFQNSFTLRNVETLQWFYEATKPEFIDRFSEPFKATVRVRLMHAQVRLGLRRLWGDEHFAHHGNPISTAQTMGAGVSFGLIPPLIDHQHGRVRTISELDSVMRYWSYISYVFGAAPDIIPMTAIDGAIIADYMGRHAGGPSYATVGFGNVADEAIENMPFQSRVPAKIYARYGIAAAAYFASDKVAQDLVSGAPRYRKLWKLWVPLMRAQIKLVVQTNIAYRRLLDALPDAQRRLANRARHYDKRYHYVVQKQKKSLHTGYTHHDTTIAAASDPASFGRCPVR
ncbi:oxygenase MpaB family protein [Mycobacterium sp. DL99]|uniref:oxygenase MpaB family protein n=1 Tax=Mycobacterium sp. DL99 TaxID=2528957 RepID=UPI0010802944|nr:oxygenase MpaB family protein [Mycobacterium sp. DL99]